jgi:RNA polymerase sigma-70 factor, ECF subfamily
VVVVAKEKMIPLVTTTSEDLGVTFTSLRKSLRNYFRSQVDVPSIADDLVQDVFVKALASKRAGHRVGNLTGWIYATARTTLIDYYRSRGEPMKELNENISAHEDDSIRLHEEISHCLKRFMEQLPPIYRDTLLVTDIQGMSMRTLAEKQDVSVSAIKSRACRARTMLKHKLLECCQVEMTDGLVSDYHRISQTCSGEKCA